jgi:hypothetical protein
MSSSATKNHLPSQKSQPKVAITLRVMSGIAASLNFQKAETQNQFPTYNRQIKVTPARHAERDGY